MKSPEQQSILAAEILGWKEVSPCHGSECKTWQLGKRIVPTQGLPAFHADANASLMLIEWMAKPENGGCLISVASCVGGGWTATFRSPFRRDVPIHALTFQLAVLGAFLRANGKEVA